MSADGVSARIIITGQELVTGHTADVNGPFLAARLTRLGVRCHGIHVVGDDPQTIRRTVTDALEGSGLVLVSGGLGPTGDDTTRQALADATGRPLVEPPALSGHRAWPLPEGAEAIDNPKGSAAGIWLAGGAWALAALPGVPWELAAMWDGLEARIRDWLPEHAPWHTATLRTVGRVESETDRTVAAALVGVTGLSWGVTAYPLRVDVHLGAASRNTLQVAERRVRDALGDTVYGTGEETLAQVVGRLLSDAGKWVAVAESCTGGAICAALTAVPGASAYVDRGVVTYTNRAKTELLGVPEALLERHGAVSEPAARAMAEGLLERSRADLTLAVTGIAGPTGGTPEKPVGLVYLAVATPQGTFCRPFRHPGDRARVIERTVNRGLDLVRRCLILGPGGLERRFSPEGPG